VELEPMISNLLSYRTFPGTRTRRGSTRCWGAWIELTVDALIDLDHGRWGEHQAKASGNPVIPT